MAKRNVVDFKIINLSEEKFQELKEAGQIDPNALYTTPDTTKERLDALENRATSLETKTTSLETTTVTLTTTKANDNSVVHLTGDETIDGTKRFLKSIVSKTAVLGHGETDDSFLEIWSASSYDRGAFLSLYGKDHPSGAGQFNIVANNGSATKALVGKADGSLTWDKHRIATVVWTQYPTESNGYTWARKYSDGWVEQGCSRATTNAATSLVTFPIPFIDNGYSFNATSIVLNTNAGDISVAYSNKNTTSIGVQVRWQGVASAGYVFMWMACGYAAS